MATSRKYITAFCTAIITLSSIGAPMMVFRCEVSGKYQHVNCCPVTAVHQPHGGSIEALPCMTATEYGIPLKTNVVPNFHKIFAAHIIVVGLIPVKAAISALTATDSFGQDSREYLPPPLLLSHTLLI